MPQNPIPLIAPRSTERRMDHFDDSIYTGTPDTLLYKFVDAVCGTTGAGSLVNEIFLARANTALETIYFNDLDYIFGSVRFLVRTGAESYDYNPMVDLLTSDQWDEVRTKDAWYRDRISKFFKAVDLGGTPEGIRTCVYAALGVECDLFETWRYKDNFGLGIYLGRAPVSARNELVIRPHKDTISPGEIRLLREMLGRIAPTETIITVSPNGLAVSSPVAVSSATADSTYYEVQKMVTPTPLMDQLPPPELLPIDLLSTEQWMYSKDPTLAPYAAFNITSEYSYNYLMGDGARSPIDSVTYGTLGEDGVTINPEQNFEVFGTDEQYTEWITYEKADSPDNFPGGKYGITPDREPALNPDRTPYRFSFESQSAFITQEILRITSLGGTANASAYRLPVTRATQIKRIYWPEQAIATVSPPRDSTVSASITQRRYKPGSAEMRDPIVFVR